MPIPERLSDLPPRSNAAFAALMLAGLLAVGCLEGLYAWMPRLASLTTDGRVAALDLEGEGSLAVWFSTGTMETAAAVALLIYALRRQTPGAGRARIWLCAATVWLVMSVDECASLHEAFKELMSHATGNRILGDGTIWWAGAYAIVLSALGLGLLQAMWPCRSAMLAMFATAAFYAVAVAAEMALILPRKDASEVMLEEGCEMIGNLSLLLSMGLYARHAARAVVAAAEPRADELERIVRLNRAAIQKSKTSLSESRKPGIKSGNSTVSAAS